MTRGQLRARVRRITDEAESDDAESGELNLVPFLDIVTNMLMFLLVTMAFVGGVAHIPLARASETCVDCDGDGAPAFALAVHVGARGVTIADGTHVEREVADVAARLDALKAAHPDETRAVLSADPEIPYQRVIDAIDVVRRDFPDVSLGAGVATP